MPSKLIRQLASIQFQGRRFQNPFIVSVLWIRNRSDLYHLAGSGFAEFLNMKMIVNNYKLVIVDSCLIICILTKIKVEKTSS